MSPTEATIDAARQSIRRALQELEDDLEPDPDVVGRRALRALAEEAERLSSSLRRVLAEAAPTEDLVATHAPLVVAVDDDALSLSALRSLLEPEFEVVTTTDPREAIGLAHRLHPEALLCDLHMPQLDGHSLLATLRSDEEAQAIPCLFITASADPKDKVRAFEAGVADYLTKPVDPVELIARLRHAITVAKGRTEERNLDRTDDLTGLPTRREFRRSLRRALRSSALDQKPLSVAIVDQDGLKQINDRHGHAAGDRALATLASTLRRSLRLGDIAARIGGDEFGVIMPAANSAGAVAMLERASQEMCATPIVLDDGTTLPLSFSFGVASLRPGDPIETLDQLLRHADLLLYEQKRTKRERPSGSRPMALARR